MSNVYRPYDRTPWLQKRREITSEPFVPDPFVPAGRLLAGALFAVVAAAWAPEVEISILSSAGGGPVGGDAPPQNARQYVNNALIGQSWEPEARTVHLKTSGGGEEPFVVHTPPRQRDWTPHTAWERNVSVLLQKPLGGGNVEQAAPYTPVGRTIPLTVLDSWAETYTVIPTFNEAASVTPAALPFNRLPAKITESWLQTWDAQRAPLFVHAAVQPQQVPFARLSTTILQSWEQKPLILDFVHGEVTVSVDNPPARSRLSDGVLSSWLETWNAQRSSSFVHVSAQPERVPFARLSTTITKSWEPEVEITFLAHSPPTPAAPEVLLKSGFQKHIFASWDDSAVYVIPYFAEAASVTTVVNNPPPLKVNWSLYNNWNVDRRVLLQQPIGGGAQQEAQADNPPPRRLDRFSSIDLWSAEPKTIHLKSIGGGSEPPVPTVLYTRMPSAVLAPWIVSWSAQKAAPSAAWNFVAAQVDNPTPKTRLPDTILQSWTVPWDAQKATPNAAWNVTVAAVHNPPPYKNPIYQIAGVFRSFEYSIFEVSEGVAGAISVDNPPKKSRLPETILISWAEHEKVSIAGVSESAASATSVDNPPRKKTNAELIAPLWVQTWSAQKASPSAAWNVVVSAVHNPPIRSRTFESFSGLWQQTWETQKLVPTAGWNFPPAQVDQPPRAPRHYEWMYSAWRGIGIADVSSSESSVLSVDNPPPPTRHYEWMFAAWKPITIAEFATGEASVSSVDNPPSKARPLEVVLGSWKTTWDSQKARPSAAWNFIPAQVDQPPVRSRGVPGLAEAWKTTWGVQSFSPNAAWNVRPPDNPPVIGKKVPSGVVAQWVQTWDAQRSILAIIPSTDQPPVRQTYGLMNIVPRWIISWEAQNADPNAGWNVVPPDNPPPQVRLQQDGLIKPWFISWNHQTRPPKVRQTSEAIRRRRRKPADIVTKEPDTIVTKPDDTTETG